MSEATAGDVRCIKCFRKIAPWEGYYLKLDEEGNYIGAICEECAWGEDGERIVNVTTPYTPVSSTLEERPGVSIEELVNSMIGDNRFFVLLLISAFVHVALGVGILVVSIGLLGRWLSWW